MRLRSLSMGAALCAASSLLAAPAPLALLGLAGIACASGSAAAQQSEPGIITDEDDYAPGEIAFIAGWGFLPGELIDLSISIDDPIDGVHIADYAWQVEQADANGEFQTTFLVPPEAAGMVLTLTAMGYSSANVATTRFTDSHFYVSSASIVGGANSVTVNVTIGGGAPLPNQVQIQVNGLSYSSATATPATAGPYTFVINGLACGQQYTLTQVQARRTGGGEHNGYGPGLKEGSTSGPDFVHRSAMTNACPPACTATNTAPSVFLSQSQVDVGAVLNCNGTPYAVVLDLANFVQGTFDPEGDPVSVRWADGALNPRTVFLTNTTSSVEVEIEAVDNPASRNEPNCPALPQLASLPAKVTVGGSVPGTPTNTAPEFTTIDDYHAGNFCVSGTEQVISGLTPGDFNASATDPDNDEVTLSLSTDSVTLELPENCSSKLVTVELKVRATDDGSSRNNPLACSQISDLTTEECVFVSAWLHRNRAPVISASDYSVGTLYGCLNNGQFGVQLPVSLASFGASATDPDNDQVSLSANVASVQLIGPGYAEATVVLTATDDGDVRSNGACAAMTTTKIVKVTGTIAYNYRLMPPLNNARKSSKVKWGSTLPIKLQILDCAGNDITAAVSNNGAGILTADNTLSAPKLVLYATNGTAPNGAVDFSNTNGPPGETTEFFRYSPGSPTIWIYNLKTNSINPFCPIDVNRTYEVKVQFGDSNTDATTPGGGTPFSTKP